MTSAAEILIVDDERCVRQAFRALLETEGFVVREARNGEEALALVASKKPDLVLLDMMMPKKNGLQTCEELRHADALLPILFLTAVDTETTQLRAFGVGADDYLAKDANPDLLVAKIRAALRRVAAQNETTRNDRVVQFGKIRVDLALLRVTDGDSFNEELTKTEAILLSTLLARRGEYLTNDDLFSAVHGVGFAGDTGKIRNHISTLRKKLGVARDLIVNNPNAGYRLI